MNKYTLAHVRDAVLLRDLAALVARDRVTTAMLLAHIAEVDARRLYVPAGYPSMHAYCVDELRLSEDAALRRIQAARAGRRFPALLTALAGGRLHLTAACLIAPHLTPENADELIEAVTHRRKSEIEDLLARRFPPSVVTSRVRAVTPLISELPQHAPERVGGDASALVTLDEHAPAHAEYVRTSSDERYLVQVTVPKSTRDKLRHAQDLLGHAVPNGDVAQVLDRALDALITQLEKRKLGAGSRRPRSQGTALGKRYVPAHVRLAVWERDQGQCTFVSASGTRCQARRFLEFDHVEPVARGGEASVNNMRLRCRAHNQYEAERSFGAGFMNRKRHGARLAAGKTRTRNAGTATAVAAGDMEQAQDVLTGLRTLGCRADEARRAAEFSTTLHDATLEERMRVALRFLSPPMRTSNRPAG